MDDVRTSREAHYVSAIYKFVSTVYNYHNMDIIHRPDFYLRHTIDNVRTSPETHYVSDTSPAG
jgi:hypothetical protein